MRRLLFASRRRGRRDAATLGSPELQEPGARALSVPPAALACRRSRRARAVRARGTLLLPAGDRARALPNARRDEPDRDRADRSEPRRHPRPQRHRACAELLGLYARDPAFAGEESGGDDRRACRDRRRPAARSQALQEAPRRVEELRKPSAAHPVERQRSRALRGESLPFSRRRDQGAALSPISVRRSGVPRRRLYRAHQRSRPRAHRGMGRDRELQGLRLHRQGRRRALVRARAARNDRRRGGRGRRRRARGAHAVARGADVGQRSRALARHQAAGGRRSRVRHAARRAGGARSDERRDPRARLQAGLRSQSLRRRHRLGELGAPQRFARQAVAQPAAARRLSAGLCDQAVPRALRALVGETDDDADDLRSRLLPASGRGAPLQRRQAGRPRQRRHVQVDRRLLRHVLLHSRERDRHRRHVPVHDAIRIRSQDRHRRRGRASRRAPVARLEASALRRKGLPRRAPEVVPRRQHLRRHRAGLQRVHADSARACDLDDCERRRVLSAAPREIDPQHRHRRCPRNCDAADQHGDAEARASGLHQEGARRRQPGRHERRGVRQGARTRAAARPAPRRFIR